MPQCVPKNIEVADTTQNKKAQIELEEESLDLNSQDSSEALIEVGNSDMENLGSDSDDDDGYMEVVLQIHDEEKQAIEEEKEAMREAHNIRECMINGIYIVDQFRVPYYEIPLYNTYCFVKHWMNSIQLLDFLTNVISQCYNRMEVFIIGNEHMAYVIPSNKARIFDQF